MIGCCKRTSLVLPLLILMAILAGCSGQNTINIPVFTPGSTYTSSSQTKTSQTTLTSTTTPASIPISWESMGGPSGGRISQLIQNPFGRHELYTLSAHGVYKSEDKGDSWQLVEKSDSIGATSIAVFKDKLFVAGSKGAYCFQGDKEPVIVLNQGCTYLMVSDNKLFATITYGDRICPGVFYTDLTLDKYNWNDISPIKSELSDIRLPKNNSFWYNISARNIVALENRILANIVMEIEGSGIETNGGLYISEDKGDTWSRVNLDVPRDVVISNIVQDPGDANHILFLFKHPILHEYTYPESELVRESHDGGNTWLRVTDFSQKSNGITDIAILGSTYYLINPYSNFILKLEGSTQEIISMPTIASFPNITFSLDGLLFDKDNPEVVYGKCGTIWGYGLVKSIDGMKTWQKMDGGIVASSPNVIVTHPIDSQTVFTTGNFVQEKYCTRDGGKTWEPFSPVAAGNELKVDPYNSNHMILVDEMTHIYESYDGGRTFTQISVNFSSAKIPALAVAPEDSDRIFVSNLGTGVSEYQGGTNWRYLIGSPDYAYDIKFDPEDSDILYATYSPKVYENYSSIWRYDRNQTENYGWTEILRLENTKGITSLEFDKSDPKRMYAGVIGEEGTIYVSNDKGNTWGKLNEDLTFTTIWGHSQLQIDPRDKNTVYAGTWGGGTFKTGDGGQNWQLLDINHTFSPTCLAISEVNPNIMYACDRTKALIHRSDDAGKTWYTYYDFGQEYMLTSSVAIDPNNPDIIYASAFKPPLAHRGAFVKIEKGQKLTDLGTDLPRSVLEIEIDKKSPNILYVTTHIYGVFKSIDGGSSFRRLDDRGTGLPRTGIYDIDVDPVDDNVLYATALSGALPDYMVPSPNFPNLEGQCGVYKSKDGGENWSLVLPTVSEARGIDIDPKNNSNLYVADMMGGVWVSNNAGLTWRQENNGLGSISMTSVKIKDGNIYASTQGSGVYAGTINADKSITWDTSRSNKPKAYVSKIQIKVDPTNSNRIYASAYPGGLLRSDDGGKHWNDKNFLTPSIKVDDPAMQGYYSFDINPKDTNIIWLGAYGKGIYVSYDGMEYDMVANGADNIMAGKHITDVRIDPNDTNTIYAATQEGVYVTRDSGKHWEAINQGLETLDIRSLRVVYIQSPPFDSNFESGNTQGWTFTDAQGQPTDTSWSVIEDNGNHVLQGTGHSWANAGSRSWTDYIFSTRIKLVQGGVHVNVRVCDEGRYFLQFSQNGLNLAKQYDKWNKFANSLVNVPRSYNLNQWYDLKIEVNGSNIKISLDGLLKIDYTDPEPLLQGAIAFETLDDSWVLVDDVHLVSQPGSQVYAGTAGYGIYKFEASTLNWRNLGRTLGTGYWSPWERRMYQFTSLMFDPDVSGKVYYGHFPGGFFISEDSGHSWKDSSLGLGNDGIFSSVVMHPQDRKVLFAGSYNGVVKSVDGGKTWTKKNTGIPSEQWPYTVAIDSQNPKVMYISTKNGQNKGFSYRNTFYGVVMKSVDGGESWLKIMTGLDEKSEFYTLLIYPLNHNILFLSTNQGVYISEDAGKSWKSANNGLPSTNNQVRDNVAQNMALTPDNKHLILGLVDYGVWRADISGLIPDS
jgi:photosystem II stability/assembly factor-like uncharacterized protein